MKPLSFNLKEAKKISGDKQSSTFKLKDGHELRIAHAPLSPLTRKAIERLPVHLEGGGPPSDSMQDETSAPTPTQPTAVPTAEPTMDADSAPVPLDTTAEAAKTDLPNQGAPIEAAQAAPFTAPATVDLPAAVQLGNQAIIDKAKNESDLAKLNAKSEQSAIDAERNFMDSRQQNLKDFTDEQQKFMADLMNNKINPDHYLEDRSSAQKVSQAIGLLLGGWSSGFTKQGNPALDFINKQIDRDIDAQKSRIGQQKTLLEANQNLYHDKVLAENATRMQMNEINAHQVSLNAAKIGTPQAEANKKAALAKWALENADLLQKSANRATILHNGAVSSASGQPSSIDPAKLVPISGAPPEEQKEMLKEIGNAQAASSVRDSLLAHFDQAAKDVRFASGQRPLYSTILTPPSIKAMGPMEDSMIHDNEGRVNEFEKKDLTTNRPQAWDSDEAVAVKRKAYEDFIDKKLQAPTSSAYGLNLQNYASTAGRPAQSARPTKVGDIGMQNGKRVQIVDTKGNTRPVQ